MEYNKLEVLGSGAFGTTYLIKYKNGFAAMKEMKEKSIYEKAKEEFRIMLKLRHNNIVRIYEYTDNEKEKKVTIIMEYCKYGSLKNIIQSLQDNNLNLSKNGVLHYFVGMILGLQYLHHHNILHRDLKSDNIFINADNIALIGDFGWSKETDLTTTIAGSPLYMAPEILKDAYKQSRTDSYSTEVDIYSLGCILHELCTNEPPYHATEIPPLIEKQKNYSFDKRIPDDLIMFKDIIRSCLDYDPSKRPSIDDLYNNEIVKDYILYENSNFFFNSNTHQFKSPYQAENSQSKQQYNLVVENPMERNPMYDTIITHNENDNTNNEQPLQQQPLLTLPPQLQQQSPYQLPPQQQQLPQQQFQQQQQYVCSPNGFNQPINNYGNNQSSKTLQPQNNNCYYANYSPPNTFPPNDVCNQYNNPAVLNRVTNMNYQHTVVAEQSPPLQQQEQQQNPPREKKRPKVLFKKTMSPATLSPQQRNIQLPSTQQPKEENENINYPFIVFLYLIVI